MNNFNFRKFRIEYQNPSFTQNFEFSNEYHSLQHVTSTQGPLLFRPKMYHLHTSLQYQFVISTQIPHFRMSLVWKWRICLELTDFFGSYGLVSNWRICVELTDLCGTDGSVWKSRICVELTDFGAEKKRPMCGNDALKGGVCGSDGSLFKSGTTC